MKISKQITTDLTAQEKDLLIKTFKLLKVIADDMESHENEDYFNYLYLSTLVNNLKTIAILEKMR